MTQRPKILLIEIISAFALGAACLPASGTTRLVPEGFEDLVLGQEEQVDVQLLGRSIGLFTAKVTPETLSFNDPASLVSNLGLDSARDAELISAIESALGQELPRNSTRACYGGQSGARDAGESCNYVETATAAVIFDESQGVAHLFLAQDWLEKLPSVKAINNIYHQISSRAENAFVHSQSINWSADTNRSRSVSANGVGALGLTRRGYMGVDWSASSYRYTRSQNNQFSLGSLYFRQDVGDAHYVQLGRMDQRNLSGSQGGGFGFSLLPIPQFDGVRVGSTTAYVNRNAVGNATPLTVMLNAPAQVDVYRGEQLLSTQHLDAGVQRLDTNPLPEGSYVVRLRIIENGVYTRSEESPFTKAAGGFNSQDFQWFFQGGRVLANDRPRVTGYFPVPRGAARDPDLARHVAQIGVRKGWRHAFVTSAGVSTVGGKYFGETAIEWRQPMFSGTVSGSASIFAGTDGSRGNTQNLSYSNGVGVSVYRYQRRSPEGRGKHPSFLSLGDYDSISTNLFVPVGNWYLSAGYSQTKSLGRPFFNGAFDQDGFENGMDRFIGKAGRRQADQITRALNVSASRAMRIGQMNLSTRIGVSQTTGSRSQRKDRTLFAGLSLSEYSPSQGSINTSTSSGLDVRSSRNGTADVNYNANKSWSWQEGAPRSVSIGVGGYKADSFFGNVNGAIDSRHGRLTAGLAHAYRKRDGKQNTAVSGSYTSSMAVNGSGLFWGTAHDAYALGAAVAVKVAEQDALDRDDESSTEPLVEVLGSGPKTMLGYGQQTLMSTAGYSDVRVTVRDASSADSSGSVNVYKGAGDSREFLPPGKLVTHHVAAAVTYTYLGRALSPDGAPLAGARILDVSGAVVAEDGGFVVDTDARLGALHLIYDGKLLQVPLLVEGKRDIVQMVGEVRAVPIDVVALPSNLRLMPRVNRLVSELSNPGEGSHRPLARR